MQIKHTDHRLFKVTDMSVVIGKQESEAVNSMHV